MSHEEWRGEHPEWSSEIGQRAGQGLAVLATLSEAGARVYAEESRRRERRQEQAEQRAEATRTATEHADGLARHAAGLRAQHDRRTVAQASDPDWIARADLLDLARVWRTARVREREFPEAGNAARIVEERLREMYPRPMDLYDQTVTNGASPAAAMRVAAAQMARTPVMRAHGGRNSAAIGAPPVGAEVFDTAVAAERDLLARGVDLGAYIAELSRLGAGGDAAAQALREVLAARTGQEQRQGAADAATPDDPATVTVDEHQAVGMPSNARDVGDANRDQAAATAPTSPVALVQQWYPDGPSHGATLPAHLAGTRAANVPTSTRTTGRSR